MNNRFVALVVYDHSRTLQLLDEALSALPVDPIHVGSCRELNEAISTTRPHLIFTDTSLPDGTWEDAVEAAEKSELPVNVIVVGSYKDTNLYISTLERGAFDFILPPFERRDLEFVVKGAGNDAYIRRQTMASCLNNAPAAA